MTRRKRIGADAGTPAPDKEVQTALLVRGVANEKGATPLKALARLARPNTIEQKVDAAFLHALWHHFGDEPFERGNLDAARLSLLFGREVLPADKTFDPLSYEAMLVINEKLARQNFPESFENIFEI